MRHSPFCLIAFFTLIASPCVLRTFAQDASPFGQEALDRAFADLRAGNLSGAGNIRALIELRCARAEDEVKLQGLESLIQLAAAVLATRDRTIDTTVNLGLWPEFDAQAYGHKLPIFAGTNPDTIEDAKVRDALKIALSKRLDAVTKLSGEKDKVEAVEGFLLAAKNLMEQINSPEAVARVNQVLSKLSADPWIGDIARRGIFPSQPADSLKDGPPQPSAPAPRITNNTATPPITQTVSSDHKASEAKQPGINKESSSSWSWSVLGGLMVAAASLLWLWLKGRK